MAEEKRKQAAGKLRGKLPTKRSINLMVLDEKKINPVKAVLGIVLIIALAGVFSKYLVLDRLNSVSAAEAKAARLQSDLDKTNAALDEFGEIEDTYAHYTLDGMTYEEMSRVDRAAVLRLVVANLPVIAPEHTAANVNRFLAGLFRPAPVTGNSALDAARLARREALKDQLIPPPEYTVSSWNVRENILTLQVTAQTLEKLNELARKIEQSPIVNTCTISTANMKQEKDLSEYVTGKIIVYLQQAAEEPEEAPEEVAGS